MEVDRVTQMGGLVRDGVPSWPKSAPRRRKFTTEVEEEVSDEEEAETAELAAGSESETQEEEKERGCALDVMA
jgi:hypothetical protein